MQLLRVLRSQNNNTLRPHQKESVMQHLKAHVEAFDNEFSKNGQLGSLTHLFARQQFIYRAAKAILNWLEENPDHISELDTESTIEIDDLNITIDIKTVSTFKSPESNTNQLFDF